VAVDPESEVAACLVGFPGGHRHTCPARAQPGEVALRSILLLSPLTSAVLQARFEPFPAAPFAERSRWRPDFARLPSIQWNQLKLMCWFPTTPTRTVAVPGWVERRHLVRVTHRLRPRTKSLRGSALEVSFRPVTPNRMAPVRGFEFVFSFSKSLVAGWIRWPSPIEQPRDPALRQ